MNKLLLAACTLIAALAIAPAAGAVTYVDGTGEPAFTNTTTNTQWIKWQGSSAYETYRLEFDHYDNNQFVTTEITGNVAANGSGTSWVNWAGIVSPLLEGHTYTVCAYGRYTIGGVGTRDTGSCFDADQNGKRASTTIDRTKPAIAVSIDHGAAYSRTAHLNYQIDYSDNLAFPFPANFICRDIGPAPDQACANTSLAYNEACSVPLGGMKKVTYFNCDEDLSAYQLGDVPVTLCVISADAAIPDNPSSSNQFATADKANLSGRVCDSITLDRTAPALAVDASGTSVTVGDLVSLTAQGSDATSGLSGNYAWGFGDNTTPGAGASVSHTFTAAGTYEVSVVTTDNAGNETTAKKVITVNAKPTSNGSNGGSSGGSGTTTTPPKIEGPAQSASVAGLDVLAPKRVKLTAKTKSLGIALTAETPGTVSLALVRGGRIAAQRTANIAGAGTVGFKLRLPKKLKAGAYQLKISFQPQGAAKATTKTVRMTFTAAKKKKKAKARAAVAVPLVDAAGAPRGLPTGTMPNAPRSRSVNLPVR
jgi:plastocyanin